MKKITNNEELFGWSRNAVYGASAVLLLIIGIATTAYFVGRQNLLEAQSPIPVIDLASRAPQVLGATVFNWNGIVVDHNESNNELTVQTSFRDAAGQIQEKRVTVQIDHNLEIIRWDVTEPSTDEGSSHRTRISLADLKDGSQITIQTEDDIRTSDQITAQAISQVVTPFSN